MENKGNFEGSLQAMYDQQLLSLERSAKITGTVAEKRQTHMTRGRERLLHDITNNAAMQQQLFSAKQESALKVQKLTSEKSSLHDTVIQ